MQRSLPYGHHEAWSSSGASTPEYTRVRHPVVSKDRDISSAQGLLPRTGSPLGLAMVHSLRIIQAALPGSVWVIVRGPLIASSAVAERARQRSGGERGCSFFP